MSITQNKKRAKADYDEVYEAGKKAEYDAFWDAFQKYGAPMDYSYAFAFTGWTEETYKPKYPIKATNAAYMFKGSKIPLDLSIDFYDFSETVQFMCFVQNSGVYKAGVINPTRYSSGAYYAFNEASELVTIEKLIVNENTKYQMAFAYCHKLEEIRIEGTIGQNGFDIHWSTKLSKASIQSIINALSTTTSGLTVTLPKVAVDREFEDHEGDNNGTQSVEWAELITTRSNCTIALA